MRWAGSAVAASQARLLALIASFDVYPELGEWSSGVQHHLSRQGSRDRRASCNVLASFYIEENAKMLVRQASAARLTSLNQGLMQMREVYTPSIRT